MTGTGIVYMDNPDNVAESLFHSPSQNMQTYIGNSVRSYVNAVQNTAPEFAASVMNRYQQICSSSAVQYVKNVRNRLNSLWQTDCIRYLSNIDKIQQAPQSMYRYVMAQPYIQELHQNGGVSAFDNKYVDAHPGVGVGGTHYDYRRVTDGVIMQKDGFVGYTNYYEAGVPGEDILSVVQKNSILATWDVIQNSINSGDTRDPTSPWNGTL